MILSRYLFTTSKRCFSSGLYSISNFDLISTNDVLPSLTRNKQITQRIISGTHDPSLINNIILGQHAKGWSHIELTKDHIRIEYQNISQDFVDSAKLYFEADETLTEKGIPLCFKPKKIENNVCFGAGATIFLDRCDVADYMREQQKERLTE